MPRRSDKPTGAVWALLQQWGAEKYHLNQEQMGKALGVSGSTVSNWKYRQQAFTQEDQIAFAKESGIRRSTISLAADADWPHVKAYNENRPGKQHPDTA